MKKKRKDLAMNCIRMDEEDMPLKIRKDMQYIERTKLGFYCKVCRAHIEITTSDQVSTKNLALHCQGKYHKLKSICFKENSKSSQLSTSKGLVLYQEKEIILKTDLKMDEIVEQNELYVTWKKDSWFCHLCKKYIPFSNEKNCRNNLAFHFDSRSHQIKFKQELPLNLRNVSSSSSIQPVYKTDLVGLQVKSILKKLLSCSFVTKINEQYFIVKGNQYFCELCKLLVVSNNKGNLIEQHCKTNTHICNLHTMAYKFLSSLNIDENLSELGTNHADILENELEDFVSELRGCFSSVAPSMKFICLRSNKFLCLLCNMTVKKSQEGGDLKKHLVSKTHKHLCYKLVCEQHYKPGYTLKELSSLKQKLTTKSEIKPQQLDKKKRSRKKKKLDSHGTRDKVPEESCFLTPITGNETVAPNKCTFDGKCLKTLCKDNLEINLNENYLKSKENRLYCEACKELFGCSTTACILEQHCQSVTHNMKLSKHAVDFVTKANKKYFASPESQEKFTTVVHRMNETFPTIKSTHHLDYIIHDGSHFVCLLCKSSIEIFGKGLSLVQHFCSDNHKEKDYKLFCSSTEDDQKSSSVTEDMDFFSQRKQELSRGSFGFHAKESNSAKFLNQESDKVLDSWEDYLLIQSEEDVKDEHVGSNKTVTNDQDLTFTAEKSNQVVEPKNLFRLEELRTNLPSTNSNQGLLDEEHFPQSKSYDKRITNNPVFTFTAEKSNEIIKTSEDFRIKLTPSKSNKISPEPKLIISSEDFDFKKVAENPVFTFTAKKALKLQNSKEKLPSMSFKENLLNEDDCNLYVSFANNMANDHEELSQVVTVAGGISRKFAVDESLVEKHKRLSDIVCWSPRQGKYCSLSIDTQQQKSLFKDSSSHVYARESNDHMSGTTLRTQLENGLNASVSGLDQSNLSKPGYYRENNISENNLLHSHKGVDSYLPDTKPNFFKLETHNDHRSDDLEVRKETPTEEKKEDVTHKSATESSPGDYLVHPKQSICDQFISVSNPVSLNVDIMAHGVVEVSGGSFICTVCNCSLHKINGQLSAEIIQTHISSLKHKEKERVYKCIKNTTLSSLIKSKISMIFYDNRQFMERRGHFFHCKTCNMDFANLNDDMLSHLNFALHFEYFNHQECQQNLYRIVPNYSAQPENYFSQSEPFGNQQKDNSQSESFGISNTLYNEPSRNFSCNTDSDFMKVPDQQAKSQGQSCINDPKPKDGTSICPECEKTFEVYNNDLEFSLQVHFQKHKTLKEANELADYEELLESLGTQELFIVIDDSDFFCGLCNCKVTLKRDKKLALTALQQHVKESYHLNQFDLFLEETSSTSSFAEPITKTVQSNQKMFKSLFQQANNIVRENEQFIEEKGNVMHNNRYVRPCNSVKPVEMLKKFLGQVYSGAVKQNIQFITIVENKFFCTLCKISMNLSLDSRINVNCLSQHFEGYNHKEHQKYLKTSVSNPANQENINLKILLGQVQSDVVKKNERFIEVIANKFHCTLCSVKMSVSPSSQDNLYNLELHCKGYNHTWKLNHKITASNISNW